MPVVCVCFCKMTKLFLMSFHGEYPVKVPIHFVEITGNHYLLRSEHFSYPIVRQINFTATYLGVQPSCEFRVFSFCFSFDGIIISGDFQLFCSIHRSICDATATISIVTAHSSKRHILLFINSERKIWYSLESVQIREDEKDDSIKNLNKNVITKTVYNRVIPIARYSDFG